MFDIFAPIAQKLYAVLPFIIAITILVFIHEYGHFWVARRNGVKVDVFSIGFGRELFGWTDSHGTRWRISPWPFGGYVKFAGDADVSSSTSDTTAINAMSDAEKAQCLINKTPLQRIAVSFAGPAANYLFAIIALAGLIMIKGIPVNSLEIQDVIDGKNGRKAGLMKGDIISDINDHAIRSTHDAMRTLSKHSGEDIIIKVLRKQESETRTLIITAPLYTVTDGVKSPDKLGITLSEQATSYTHTSPMHAIGHAINYCLTLSWDMLKGIGSLIIGRGGEMGGIGTIGVMANQAMHQGFVHFLNFLILLSVNLGLVNLLPVPVLDGGSILLSTIELIRGKPIAQKLQERIFMVGLALVGTLMLYTTLSDVARLTEITKWIKAFF